MQEQNVNQVSVNNQNSFKNLQRSSPQLAKIYADNSDKKSMIIYWGVFLLIIILALALSTTVPQAFEYRVNSLDANPIGFDANNNITLINITNTSSGILIKDVVKLNQFILFNYNFLLNTPNSTFNYEGPINISLYSINILNNNYLKDKTYYQNLTINISINAKSSQIIYDNMSQIIGYQNSMTLLHKIQSTNYLYVINCPSNLTYFKKILPYITTINKQFSVFGITLRYVLFVITIFTSCFYWYRIYKLQYQALVIEQKMIIYLSSFVIFFNDPFYIITITKPNFVNSFFSVLFVVNLLVYLFLFWVTILDKIKNQNQIQQPNPLTWQKIVFNSIIWICCLIYYLIYSYQSLNGSKILQISDFNNGPVGYLGMFIIILYVILLAYLIGLHIQIFLKFEQKIWRNKIIILFSIFFIIVINAFFFIAGVNIYEYVGKRIIILYVCANLYVIYIQYMYCPTSEAIQKHSSQFIGYPKDANVDVVTNMEDAKQVQIYFTSNYEQINEQSSEKEDNINEIKQLSARKNNMRKKTNDQKLNTQQQVVIEFNE